MDTDQITAYGLHQAKKCLCACEQCTGSHHPAHEHSLIQGFALNSNILLYQMILFVDSEGPDQTAQMCSLIWAFAVRICPKTGFCMTWPL